MASAPFPHRVAKKIFAMKNKSPIARSEFKPAKVPNTPNSVIDLPSRPVTHAEISTRAQVIWEQRGRPRGVDDEIWLEAERQLSFRPGHGGDLHESEEEIEDTRKLAERLDETGEPTDPRSSTSL